jgi:hypothetical protein
MQMMGKVGYLEGLPKEINENYYECPQCRQRDSRYFKEFGYQRIETENNEWYYFNDGIWNQLESENPSLRYPRRKVI